MEESAMTFHISLREFVEWLNKVFSRKPKSVDVCYQQSKVLDPWQGSYAQKFQQKFFSPSAQSQDSSQQLGVVKASVQSTAQTAVELTAQNAVFAKVAAIFMFLSNAIATAVETMKKNSDAYNATAQVYAKAGARMV